jgi:predicted esterase
VIGVEWARAARATLERAGADVTYRESEIGHHFDPRFLAELPAWVGGAIGRQAQAR